MQRQKNFPPGTFCWADLLCHDLEAARQYYGRLLGWDWESMDTGTGPAYGRFLLRGERVAGLGIMPPPMQARGISPLWQNYVAVENLSGTLARAEQLGAAVTQPELEIAGSGWLGSIQDPAGAHLCFWQAGADPGAGLVGEPGAMGWQELATRDPGRAMAFYERLLDWTFRRLDDSSPEYYLIHHRQKRCGGLMKLKAGQQQTPAWSVSFRVVDLKGSLERSAELGGAVVLPARRTTIGHKALLCDPQGAVFQLVQCIGAAS